MPSISNDRLRGDRDGVVYSNEADRVSALLAQLLTCRKPERHYSISFLSERLRTGLSHEEINDILDPNAEVSEATTTLLAAIPPSYYTAIIGVLAETLLDTRSDAAEGGLAND